MITPAWATMAEFEEWWKANVIAFNRLSITDPREWERVARAIEAFQAKYNGEKT